MSSKEEKSYYEILEVDVNATDKEIKKSYQILVKIYHPDKGGDEEKFKLIQKAYEILSNPKTRQLYDDGKDINSNIDQEIKGIVLNYSAEALRIYREPKNILKFIEEKLDKDETNTNNDLEALAFQFEQLDKFDGLVVPREEGMSNIFAEQLEVFKSQLNRKKEAIEENFNKIELARELLSNYKWVGEEENLYFIPTTASYERFI